MKKYILLLLFSFLFLSRIYAVPNNSMSISPSATDNTVITASDENTRNTEISSKFNAHGHTDITQTGNTLNIGDATSGTKKITAYNADTNKPYIQFNDTTDDWVISIDGTTTALVLSGVALIVSQPDGGCSSCGVDNAGTTWSCSNVTCP